MREKSRCAGLIKPLTRDSADVTIEGGGGVWMYLGCMRR